MDDEKNKAPANAGDLTFLTAVENSIRVVVACASGGQTNDPSKLKAIFNVMMSAQGEAKVKYVKKK